VSLGFGIGLGIAGLLLAARAWLTQPGEGGKSRQVRISPSKRPHGDIRECVWCDRIISPPDRACSTICDHELKHLALSHPDAICRAELQDMEYQWFGDAEHPKSTQEPE
jgi:hypothetical protein